MKRRAAKYSDVVVRKKPHVVFNQLEGLYQSFCRERYSVTGGMPDFRNSIFIKRQFNGRHFES